MQQLEQQIKEVIAARGGVWSVSIKDLQTNETMHINENQSYIAASIIKVPIMATLFQQIDQGLLKLDELYEMTAQDQVGGAGVLQHLQPGQLISLHDLLTLMIIQSDNTATNMCIEIAGIDNIQQFMKQHGMEQSEFHNRLMIVPVEIKGPNRLTTKEMTGLLEQMVAGKISSYWACEQMIRIMKQQQVHYLSKGFRSNEEQWIGELKRWELASKTGNITGICHDSGILYTPQKTMVITIFSKGLAHQEALAGFQQLGELIDNYAHQG